MPTNFIVTKHAVERYRDRLLGRRDRRRFTVIASEIEDLVRAGIERRKVFNHKPQGFGLYGVKRRQFEPHEHFVLCGEGEIGFILEDRENGDQAVVTTLTRTGGTPR